MGKESGPYQMGRLLVPRGQGNVDRCKLGKEQRQGQGWEFNQHLARSGPNLQSDVTLTV